MLLLALLLDLSPAKSDPAGALPFLPVFLQPLPTGGNVTLDSKGVTFAEGDADPQLRIGGRYQGDFGAAGIDPRGAVPSPRDAATRRAWFEAYLKLPSSIEAAFQYDFNSATQPIQDAALSYGGIDNSIVVLGNMKEPFGLEHLISNLNTLFVERSQLTAFVPARDFGVAAGTHGERWTLSGGVFGDNANQGLDRSGIAGVARVTYAPILTDTQVLHLGLAGSYRALDRDGLPLSFANTPEDFLFRKALVGTGTIANADSIARVGAEFAYVQGPFRVQAEYTGVRVGVAGGPDHGFQGAYAQAAWVLNGRSPKYDLKPPYATEWATFGAVPVGDAQRISNGGIGVFEVGGRVDAITLDSGTIRGGVERNLTAGLNWYPEPNIRLMADYVHAIADPSAASVTGRTVQDNSFVGRFQIHW